MKFLKFLGGFLVFILIVVVLLVVSIAGKGCAAARWWTGTAVETAKKEFNAGELLRKYEWFKDASAQCDKKLADIKNYEAKIKRFESLGNLDRVDREKIMVWEQELIGVKASFNGLAAEYNSQMSKINWRFCNRGSLPAGATVALEREIRSYQ